MSAPMNRVFILRERPQVEALGKFINLNWKAFAEREEPLTVTVSEHHEPRSTEQNRRYWALLTQIAEQCWVHGKSFSKEAWHHYFALQYIGAEEAPDGRMVPLSTKRLSVSDFSNYMTKIEAHATSELGLLEFTP